jgi:predicted membrane chloride channel (bestrophin family)
MIIYESGSLGLSKLGRVHGSAVYKVFLPALFSTGILLVYEYSPFDPTNEEGLAQNPYTIGAYIGFFSFLLTFRLNFAYQRYWESATAVHQMLSKWLDCATAIAAFHYQSDQFDDIRPPAFGSHPTLKSSRIKGRQRAYKATLEETMETIQEAVDQQAALEAQTKRPLWRGLRRRKKKEGTGPTTRISVPEQESTKSMGVIRPHDGVNGDSSDIPIPQRFQDQFTLEGQQQSPTRKSKRRLLAMQSRMPPMEAPETRRAPVPVPSLFLQETAHLISLMSAVAMSTLRNDSELTESPLTEYMPGKPWPPVDPDSLSDDIREQYGDDNTIWRWIYFCLGLSRSERHRTLYNAARPFAVLGGVSDREVELLQRARGPYAKLSLCTMWFQEFLTRETLSGSTGNINGAILSRLYQFTSDGVAGYNHARKVAYVPFPFPHAQITAVFSMAIIFIFPLLYFEYINSIAFGSVLNFATVLCFLGVHEVARELENPFVNVPNDIPLTTFQAQFNEALVTFYSGYHPDSWWEVTPEEAKALPIL